MTSVGYISSISLLCYSKTHFRLHGIPIPFTMYPYGYFKNVVTCL